MDGYRTIRSYVLRSGRQTPAQERAYETLKGRYCLSLEGSAVFDFRAVYGNDHPVIAEIGFGMGLVTAKIAQANPDRNYLGIEVYPAGIGKLLSEIHRQDLKNLRIIEGDAVELFPLHIPDRSLGGIHLFFPDPWPKKRHHKRRLVTRPFTDTLAAKLLPGGYLYMVTDWADYAQWALEELAATPGLVNPSAGLPGGFAVPQTWRPVTRFEEKGRAKGHQVWEIYVVRTG
jgi:tRNA (guanine-N7-)-methyltransferase